jgi:hypothetical protein
VRVVRRDVLRRPARPAASALIVVLLTAASGCGSGGASGASKQDYYASINTFCGRVASAARQVSTDTAAVRKDTAAPASRRFKAITVSLRHFAASTETALQDLEKTKVPSQFASYQKGTSAGFRTFITTLRTTADAADKNGPAILTKLQARLNAVKLPDPPKDITANAKACASFSPAG